MQPIGERLEEARKRQGISIREAAEATKVRSDFLLSFENNQFDFDLPEVYKIGFLKLYARYLKLDDKKLHADYEAAVLRQRSIGKRDAKSEHYGRLDLPTKARSESATTTGLPTMDEAEEEEVTASRERIYPVDSQTDPTLYWKIGLAAAGTLILLVLLVIVIRLIFSSPATVDNGASAQPDAPAPQTATSTPAATAANQVQQFTVIISGDTSLRVRESSGQVLHQGRMTPGQSITLTSNGPAVITATDIEYVTVEKNGRTIRARQGETGTKSFLVD